MIQSPVCDEHTIILADYLKIILKHQEGKIAIEVMANLLTQNAELAWNVLDFRIEQKWYRDGG